jgi:hypothetical protein
MWKEYGNDGVAITSRFRLLKSALGAMTDRGVHRASPIRRATPHGKASEFIPLHYNEAEQIRARAGSQSFPVDSRPARRNQPTL